VFHYNIVYKIASAKSFTGKNCVSSVLRFSGHGHPENFVPDFAKQTLDWCRLSAFPIILKDHRWRLQDISRGLKMKEKTWLVANVELL
jgi:hypothetical protein